MLWQTEDCKDDSTLHTQHVTISSHNSLIHEGKITAEVTSFQGSAVSLRQGSEIKSDILQVEGTSLIHHGGIVDAKEVNFISEATLEDAGQILADDISLQAKHHIKRLQGAVAKAEHIFIDSKEGDIIDHGKMSLHAPINQNSYSSAVETLPSHKAAVSIAAKSITLSADSEIKAPHQAVVIQSTDDTLLAGKINASFVQIQANTSLHLHETGSITTESLSAKASTITQNSHLVIHPVQHKPEVTTSLFASESEAQTAPKTILVDVNFEGSQSVKQGESGNIDAVGAVIAMTSTNEVIDAGHMNAKQVLLRGDKTVERLATASMAAEQITIGTATSNTIDHGKLTLTTVTDRATHVEPSLDEQGLQVTLGESYQLTALEQTIHIHSENKLTVAGELTAGEINFSTNEQMQLNESAYITAHRVNASAKNILQNSHMVVDGVANTSSDPLISNEKNKIVADVSLNGSEQMVQGMNGYIEAKKSAVLFNSENKVIDEGHIASEQVFLQAEQVVERTKTAYAEVSSMDIGTVTSQTTDQGKTVVTPINPSLASVLDSEPPIAVNVRGKTIVLGENQQLFAHQAQVQIDSGSDLTVAGHMTAKHIQFDAKDKIDTQTTAQVSAEVITMHANVVLQNGDLTIDKQADELRTLVNNEGKEIPVADMILNGNQQVIHGSTGRITGVNAVIQMTSPIEIIDSGELNVKEVYLEANTRVERTQTANTTADYFQLGLNDHKTTTLIDNGSFTHLPSESSLKLVGTEQHASSDVALVEQAQTIILGEMHQLTAKTGSSIFDASASLTVASQAHQTTKKVLYQAPTASVKGFIEADLIEYQVDPTTSEQVHAMLTQSGDYQQWHPKTQLTIKTTQPIQLHGSYDLPYSINLTGSQFMIDGRVHSTQNLKFTALAGDITLNHAAVSADQQLLFDTSGNYSVTESTVAGNETQILAKGSVINHHSTLEARTYLNIEAGGNVENYCAESPYMDHENAHDTRMNYSLAVLSGGTGIGYDGIGLNIKAGGRFILDSSQVISVGSNQILAEGQDNQIIVPPDLRGIQIQLDALKRVDQHSVRFSLQQRRTQILERAKNIPSTVITEAAITTTARSHQYKNTDRHDKHLFGAHKSDHVEYLWDSQASEINSIRGNNVIQSQHGSIDILATDIRAPGQTSLSAEKDIVLRELVLNHSDSRSSSFGDLESSTLTNHNEGRVTRIISIAGVNLHALNDVRIEGAQIQTAGKLEIEAGHDVIISAPILNHYSSSESISTSVQFPTCPPLSLVSVYQDANVLFNPPHSQSYSGGTPVASESNTTTKLINVSNLAIDSLNAFNGIMSGSLANSVFPASSMTVARVSLTHTETQMNWQTIDPNAGIYCGSLQIHALNSISFLNGIPIKVVERADLEAKHVVLRGAALHYSIQSNSEGINIGVSASGDLTVGASVSASSSNGNQYVNQVLNAKVVSINADTVDMDSANINTVELEGSVETLNITSHGDTSQSESAGFSFDSEGNLNDQQNNSHANEINQVSGISATDSTLNIHEANLTGSRFTVSGNNQTKVEQLNTRSVDEEKQGSSFSLCGNPGDLGGTGNRSFAQAIPTVGVNVGKGDCRAHQDSTFTGAAPQSGLDTSGGDGFHETHNTQYQQKVEIPLYNPEGLNQLENNAESLADKFSTPSMPEKHEPVESVKEPVINHTKAQANTEHKQPADQSEIKVITDAEKTLADVDIMTHKSNTHSATDLPDPTSLAHYGMWGDRAAHKENVRAGTEGSQMESGRNKEDTAPTLIEGLLDEVSNSYHSPAKLSEAFLDRASSIA